ncbi:MAG: ornithine cyclodeaminase family protein, partial [Candidatus Omnitrophota bacterium]
HSGEINVPLRKKQLSKKDVCANIGEIVAGKKKGRKKRDDITVFDSTGLAVQDIAIADLVYRKARRLGKGKFIEF